MKKFLFLLTFFVIFIFNGLQLNAQLFDSITFEYYTSKIIIDTSSGNLWQIGTPDKPFFNLAHTGNKAILTDTVNNYPPDNSSSFIYVIRNPYTSTCYTRMEFWHKYDMDTLTDIGVIDASYDGGKSWITVSDTVSPVFADSYFWWDSDYHAATGNYSPHTEITTGKSDGWILSSFNWQWWIPIKYDTIIYPLDSLMIRFTFTSDSVSTGREGWMIDDIVTMSVSMQSCSAINERQGSPSISVFPNPFSAVATIRFDKFLTNASLVLYDSFGRLVKIIDNISGQTVLLERSNLPTGIYFIMLKEKNRIVATTKIIISK